MALSITQSTAQAESNQYPARSYWLGVSQFYNLSQHPEDFSRMGFGPRINYEFVIKPKFHLAITGAYLDHFGSQGLSRVQYGLLLKHFLNPLSFTPDDYRFFLQYGLLSQIARIKSYSSFATSHDTALGGGIECLLFKNWWSFEFNYHYNRIRYFNLPTQNFDAIAFNVGWKGYF